MIIGLLYTSIALPMDPNQCMPPHTAQAQKINSCTFDEKLAQFYLDHIASDKIKRAIEVNQNNKKPYSHLLLTGNPAHAKNLALAIAFTLKNPYISINSETKKPAVINQLLSLENNNTRHVIITNNLKKIHNKYKSEDKKRNSFSAALLSLSNSHLIITIENEASDIPNSLKKIFIGLNSFNPIHIAEQPSTEIYESVIQWFNRHKITGAVERKTVFFCKNSKNYNEIKVCSSQSAIRTLTLLLSEYCKPEETTHKKQIKASSNKRPSDHENDEDDEESEEDEEEEEESEEEPVIKKPGQKNFFSSFKNIQFFLNILTPSFVTVYEIKFNEPDKKSILPSMYKKTTQAIQKESASKMTYMFLHFNITKSFESTYIDLDQVREHIDNYTNSSKKLEYDVNSDSDDEERENICCICQSNITDSIKTVKNLPCCENQIHLQCLIDSSTDFQIRCPLYREYTIDINSWTATTYIESSAKKKTKE